MRYADEAKRNIERALARIALAELTLAALPPGHLFTREQERIARARRSIKVWQETIRIYGNK